MISIIVPIFNAEKYLKTCVESLLAQTYTDIEVTLVDDGSTDGSLAIAQAFAEQDKRVAVLQQVHAGQSVARNLGMANTHGEYIAFVDADDWLEPDWCAQHMAAIEGVDYVQSGCPRHPYQFTVVWGRLYKREAIQHLVFVKGIIYEDVLWSSDLWLSGATCRIIGYKGYHYTLNPDSTTFTAPPEAKRIVVQALREKAKGASLKGKIILWYTIVRLKLHFLIR